MGLILVTPPAVEPVPLQDLKEFLKVDADDTSQDNVINALSMAARSWCEVWSGRRFVEQTWALYMDFFPGYIDLRIAGSKVSSPFVSGSNAILVGIRYAIVLPYPPALAIQSFVYQNANGLVTSMIVGPLTIGGITNTLNQAIKINTVLPHGLASGATVALAGNAPLLALLSGQASQVITVIDPNDFTVPVLGTGATIATAGTVTGYNYVTDVVSNPARLTPLFGQVWPVARVVVNAIQINFTLGYAMPIIVSMDGTTGIITSPYTFLATDVGRAISIPGAGDVNGATLNTVIASVSGGGAGTTRDVSVSAVTNVTALLVNSPNANPSHWEMFKTAIKLLVAQWYENRVPDDNNIPMSVKAVLWPTRDIRL